MSFYRLLTLPHHRTGLNISPGHVKEAAIDLGLGGGFTRYSGFLHPLQLASQDITKLIKPILGAAGMKGLELAKRLQSKLSIEKVLSKSVGVVIDLYFLREDNVHVAVVRYAVIW